ncbi:MAG TPA: FHA domain-containing protein [Herpetosiphonaceae bacterium]
MSAAQPRLELSIDVFEEKQQRALVMPTLTAHELIEAIIKEFRSLAYLSGSPSAYTLRRSRDGAALEPAQPLVQQLTSGDHLVLAEDEPPLPEGTQRPSKHAYLREEGGDKVYKLHWCPAIIGRPDDTLPHNERLVVNLASHPRGLRVSRRHAQISEDNGRFYIQGLSQNATTIKDAQGGEIRLDNQPVPLEHGQLITLDQSQITLKFILRDEGRNT